MSSFDDRRWHATTIDASGRRKLPAELSASQAQNTPIKQNKFPPGWNEQRVTRVLSHYESQTEDEAVAEDEAAQDDTSGTIMAVPTELVAEVRELIAKHKKRA